MSNIKLLVTLGGTQQGERTNTTSTNVRNFQAEADRLAASAIPWGFTPVIWDNSGIRNTSFYVEKRFIFDQPAFGWLFKPFIIRQTMAKLPMGAVVMWVDSSHTIISDPQPLVEWAAEHVGIWCHNHENRKPAREWCRRSTFIGMDCDNIRYWKSPQMQVNQLVFVKSHRVMQFVEEWLRWCAIPSVMLGADVGQPELPSFAHKDLLRDHRNEQAIFSLLIEKYAMEYAPYRDSVKVFDESEIIC